MRSKPISVATLAAISGFLFASILWAEPTREQRRAEHNKQCENNLGNYVEDCFRVHPKWTRPQCAQYAAEHVTACKDNFERTSGKHTKSFPTGNLGKGAKVRGLTDTTVKATTTSTATQSPTPKSKATSSPVGTKKEN